MKSLELRIPPPAVTVLVAAAMWTLSQATLSLRVPTGIRLSLALAVALVGISFSAAGVISFRRAKTTVNPMKPQMTSSLVCSGIYSVTRNPMYVGLLIILIAFAIFLSSAWALLGQWHTFSTSVLSNRTEGCTTLIRRRYTAYVRRYAVALSLTIIQASRCGRLNSGVRPLNEFMDYQLILQFQGDSVSDFDDLLLLEEQLIEELGDSAEVDGHDVGSGEINILIIAATPTETFERARLVLQKLGLLGGVMAAYRPVAGEHFTPVWPADSSTSFTVA